MNRIKLSILTTFLLSYTLSQELDSVQSIIDDENGVDGLNHAVSVTISPNGKNIYVTARGENKISVFKRDLNTGKLVFIEYHNSNVGIASDIAISSDARNVYLANLSSSLFTVFNRDTTTGSLTFLEKRQSPINQLQLK
jgi:6-phosphogluconolactonase (cycloisomerase 2 family)